jgi:hypothetical protein
MKTRVAGGSPPMPFGVAGVVAEVEMSDKGLFIV